VLKSFSFASPTRIVFGPGCVTNTGREVVDAGGTKVLLVTDEGVRKAGLVDGVVDSLQKAGVGVVVYDRVETNPALAVVEAGFALYRQEGCDALVAVGGGSSIDTAKAIGVLANNPPPLAQYEGADKVPNPIPPLVAVPTAAGTGAEVTFSAVITDPERHYKISVRSPKQAPRVALLDPNLLTTLPPRLAAMTGMDTLTHAVEAYTSTSANPLSDVLALEAIRMTGEWLPRFVANPRNVEAAAHMQLACVFAAVSFANARLGNVHAMAHPLGGHFNLHHGLACAIVLPRVMEFNLIGAPCRYADVARALGKRVDGLPVMEAARLAPQAVYELLQVLELPTRLSEVGVTADRIPAMARDAITSGIHATNPRLTDYGVIVRLYEACM
jgi:alcohol dehydrogenase class IV